MSNEWYLTDVPRLLAEADALYKRLAETDPAKTKANFTAKMTVKERDWAPSLPLFEKELAPAIERLGFFYLSRVMAPGPCFVFPMRDATGATPRAQTKPLEGSALCKEGVKYRYIGDKSKYVGPGWLGNDPETLRLIIEKQAVMCVEGPFDLMALRLMCPRYPTLSPLTKKLGKQHVAWLRILGVRRLFLMFDNEDGGLEAMEQQTRMVKRIEVVRCDCPRKDPSACLERPNWAVDLAAVAASYFKY